MTCRADDVTDVEKRGHRHEHRPRPTHARRLEHHGLAGITVNHRNARHARLPYAAIVELDKDIWQIQMGSSRETLSMDLRLAKPVCGPRCRLESASRYHPSQ